jgi:hypothetical protein
MNERIRELAEQCTSYNNSDGWLFDKAKFAELIVRECMTVCADNACRAGGLNTQVGEDLYLAADVIKEHFGVEP